MDSKAIKLIIMIAIVIVVAELISFILKKIQPKKHRAGTVVSLIRSLIRYAAAIYILCAGLTILGFDVKTIVASVGLVALVVGFGAESLIADIVTGIFMIFENQYNVGDIVEVLGFRGTVTDIGIRTTSIMDTGGNIKIINNSEMKSILNRSDKSSTAVSDIPISIDTDLEKLEAKLPEILKKIAEDNPIFLVGPTYAGVEAVSIRYVKLRFTADVKEADIYNAQRILNHDLLIALNKEGVVFK